MLVPYGDKSPRVSPDAFLAEGARLIGDVKVGSHASIWYNAVLRADRGEIVVGEYTSIQDCCVLHGPVTVGNYVTCGHGAILHGATVEDNCVIGMNAVILDGAVVGHGSVVAAGAVIPQGMQIPPRSMVMGVPAKVTKELPEENEEKLRLTAQAYFEFARPHMR
ncbi:gamma carbonic anhydrase family protein [Candidatus Solincola tengchongensis]|uniref:gamma carbonic anhydrase family protein n=1 Tax=Candidatus Solincola tengchongensis TaxID=2900693 RepID=UPI002579DCF4|nr:gamma carbonic anhydrase family protein [Candidatus Solincola tengchongensis]